jgi:hypothetical protein
MQVDKIFVNKIFVGKIEVGKIKVGKIKVGKIKVGKIKVGKIKVGKIKVGKIKVDNGKVGKIKVGKIYVGNVAVDIMTVGNLGSIWQACSRRNSTAPFLQLSYSDFIYFEHMDAPHVSKYLFMAFSASSIVVTTLLSLVPFSCISYSAENFYPRILDKYLDIRMFD